MKAIILSGGYGSRLRPLTLTKPKSIVQLCNVPIIEFQIAQFASIGVTDIIVALNYKANELIPTLKTIENRYGVKIHLSIEDKPLGTAGPIKLAQDLLTKDEPFFVCNSDIICNFPLREMLEIYHKKNGDLNCNGVILIKQVPDPSKYGVVLYEKNTFKVDSFIEKPKNFVGDFINAGIYILSKKILDLIKPDQQVSIEKDVFPIMASSNTLYCCPFLTGNVNIWADIGNPKDFLLGNELFMEFLRSNCALQRSSSLHEHNSRIELFEKLLSENKLQLSPESNEFKIIGNVVIHSTAFIGKDCTIGPNVVIGENCVIGEGVRLKDCIIFENTKVNSYSNIAGSIIGCYCRIGKWARIDGLSVLGDDVSVQDELFINSSIILPNKSVATSIFTPNTICL
ncbi:mannose-1-phosphate guanylyltransferase [Cryptosporidium canis]|uniref:mannose-1-phosphate guanylyltransferase n=1 Tax=Cryptosporidium canis TaxID=195482 RepID=A0ABQ8PDV1_9CRYT|nr:mannose-1-phosphate guanylyltransferase [Cryptosporidium canis]KAJ1615402.1 mannose-1-phosphate guanylyltransferase [Cryptosporidium canis]